MKHYIITIARGLGSGGSHIGHALSEQLGIDYYDAEILQMAADYSGINENYFWEANEKISKDYRKLSSANGVYNSNVVYRECDKEFLSNANLFNFQARILKNIAIEDKVSCIVIGKAANYVLRGLKNVIKVNIQAPVDKCVKNLVMRLNVNRNEAIDMIEKTDRYRADYYRYYTGRNWFDPKEYDICINTGEIKEEYAVKMIIDLLKQRNLI